MSKIQDLRNPKRTIRKRLPSRKVTFDRMVDGYAIFIRCFQYGLGVIALLIFTGMVYSFLLGIGADLPKLFRALLLLPLIVLRLPLPHIVGFLATAAFILLWRALHDAYLGRIFSPNPRGRRILSAVEARHLAEKKFIDPKNGKTRNRPKL